MNRRNFIKLGAIGSVIYGTSLMSCIKSDTNRDKTDVLVVGATPAGIMAAIAAARLGCNVILVEYHWHIGGMSTSGLGKSDIENKDAIAGLFKEFTQNIYQYYLDRYGLDSENVKKCRNGYYYEPSVAEYVFNQMIQAEEEIHLIVGHQIENVMVSSDTVKEVTFLNRENKELLSLQADIFIDATYEGDVYGLAGAAYAIGRESRTEYNEQHAGHIFFDYQNKVILEGSTGEADKRLPAYTYRLCLTDDSNNSYVMKSPPEGYNRNAYIGYLDDLKEGRLGGPTVFREGHGYYAAHFDTMVRVFSFAEIPNNKYDVNINPRPLSFPFPGENDNYVEADWVQREKVFQQHRNLALGLLYFVQNDEEIPIEHRAIANQYHLPLDEFTDNGHFPWQLYVREARRLKGKYVLTENDATIKANTERNTIFHDSVIAGEFPIDSFPASKQPSLNRIVLEGYIGLLSISPYQIPYRILIPEKVKGLIVPLAVSTSHVAYSTVRMEPLWMGLGQVAGTAAWLALTKKIEIDNIPVNILQHKLLEYNQILTYFDDVDVDDKAFKAVQFLGTKGFFETYSANCQAALTVSQLERWKDLFLSLFGVEPLGINTKSGVGEVKIVDFKKLLIELASKLGEKGDADMNLLEHFNFETLFYEVRDENLPILRGEACIGYHALYLLLNDK